MTNTVKNEEQETITLSSFARNALSFLCTFMCQNFYNKQKYHTHRHNSRMEDFPRENIGNLKSLHLQGDGKVNLEV